ncbi:AhpC/TSA family protein [Flavobacterium sp. HXWNR69]|uniref:AhpC/TSA family protein n=1 Tax=Flavobacterium fragile TaxID=2949085 RepID=A0ABT0TGF3_9FLAO|nr:TlpA disulfide reductase family protein [Flavobacterium sp. HXWNR69]MCL9770038.1 AhpC/TSA family protein [Flavobacterium sp. HXWNR69]
MKKVLFIFSVLMFTVSCNNLKDNEFVIEGTISGIADGKKVFIEVPTETGSTVKDTGIVKKGTFELKGTVEDIELGFIRVEEQEFNLPVILENGTIVTVINKDSLQNSSLKGTKNNDIFHKFNEDSKAIAKKGMKFQKENGPKMLMAQRNKDTVAINALRKEFQKFQEEMNGFSKKFIKNNPDAFLSVLLLENFMMRNYLSTDEINTLFNGLSDEVKATKNAKRLKETIAAKTAVVIGKAAPNFSAPSPEGKTITLKESLGKVTIIDFWASWCGPCRMENPNVVALYKEFNPQGLNIIGVSLDKDAAKWKEAIAKDGLTWTQVSNLKFWEDPIAKQYNVQSIPATFILDAKGNIVAKDLRGDELRAKVKELIGVK